MYQENISAAYNVSDIEIKEPSSTYDRDTKNQAEELDKLYAAIKEKLLTTSIIEKLQILTLVPDSWSRKYCSEYFEFQNISFDLQENWSKERGYLHNLLRKKVKQWPKKQLILFMLSMRMMNTVDRFPGKRLSKHTERCSQTKAVSSVQSPWIVCCI